jgi:hypothetical protein
MYNMLDYPVKNMSIADHSLAILLNLFAPFVRVVRLWQLIIIISSRLTWFTDF